MKNIINYLVILAACFSFMGCQSTKSIPVQSPNCIYKIGDAYNQNGVIGIVVKVDASGQHGLVMSLKGSNEKWSTNERFDFETTAFYEDDGQKTMDAIAKYVKSGNATWEDFPILNWARSLGDGWYIPAKDEAMEIWINMNGGSKEYEFSRMNNNLYIFDQNQRKYGGDNIIASDSFKKFFLNTGVIGAFREQEAGLSPYHWYTSTEGAEGKAYTIQFDNSNAADVMFRGLVSAKFGFRLSSKRPAVMKNFKTRAIHKF